MQKSRLVALQLPVNQDTLLKGPVGLIRSSLFLVRDIAFHHILTVPDDSK